MKQTNENDRKRKKSTGHLDNMGIDAKGILIVNSYACLCRGASKLPRTTSHSSVKHARASAVGSGLQDLKYG